MSDKRIQRNFIVLCSELEVDKVLPYLRQERMLTADEYEQLTQTGLPTRTKREKLLIILPRKGRDHFDVFVKCLVWSGQAELARKIGADVDAVPACPYGVQPEDEGRITREDMAKLLQLLRNHPEGSQFPPPLPKESHLDGAGSNPLWQEFAPTPIQPLCPPGGVEATPTMSATPPAPTSSRKSVFLLYCTEEGSPSKEDILALSHLLAACGVHFTCDIHFETDPPDNWNVWTTNQIKVSYHTLLVCSTPMYNVCAYMPKHQLVHMHCGSFFDTTIANCVNPNKFIPVFLNRPTNMDMVPDSLKTASHYELPVNQMARDMESSSKSLKDLVNGGHYPEVSSLLWRLLNVNPYPRPRPSSGMLVPQFGGQIESDDNLWAQDSKKLYTDAMKCGYVKRRAIKCLIVGAAGVGKTSVKHLILNKELPKKRESTGVVENPVAAVFVSRPVSISHANMKTNGSWSVVSNNEDMTKMIAEIIKAGVSYLPTKSQENSKIANTTLELVVEQDQVHPSVHEQDKRKVNSAGKQVEPKGTAEIQDSIHNKVISAIVEAKGGEQLSTKWIHLIDSGGQPEFHDLLPVFVPSASVVLFVFKLSEGLDEKPTVEYYGPNGSIGNPYKSYLTHREILKHCLKAFHSQDPKKCSTILLIGTHKDHPEQKLDIHELKDCLKPFQQEVIHFGRQPIAMLNCLSNGNEEKEIVNEIQKEILKVIENMESEDTPMAWFGLELALKQASQSENSKPKGILTYEQCKLEANKFEYFESNSGQFEAALDHLVKHNIFLHYEVLPDVVFCDPQVLLTMVTEIVQHHYKLKHSFTSAVKGTTFVEKAYISSDILESISSQYSDNDGVLPSESFLKLLSYLKIISAIPISGKSGVYLMPALLPNADNPVAEVEKIHGNEHLTPLCICFDGGCVPNGVFCSLVVTLLQKGWKLCEKDGKPCCCFRNCITFIYQRRTITLVDFFSHFSIYMYIPTGSNPGKVSPVIIRNIVHDSITHLQCTTVRFQDAIICPSHPKEKHVALWHLPELSDEEEYYICTVDDACTNSIPREYQMWMEAVPTVQPPPAPTPPHPALLCAHSALSGAHPDQRRILTEPVSHYPSPNPVSKEARAFVHYFAKLRENVNPDDISADLYAMSLITKNEKAEIDVLMLTKQGRMDKLLGAVLSAINIDPLKYETFLDILGKERKYTTLADEMRRSYH